MSAPGEDSSDYSGYEEKTIIINTCEECRDRLGWYSKQKELCLSCDMAEGERKEIRDEQRAKGCEGRKSLS